MSNLFDKVTEAAREQEERCKAEERRRAEGMAFNESVRDSLTTQMEAALESFTGQERFHRVGTSIHYRGRLIARAEVRWETWDNPNFDYKDGEYDYLRVDESLAEHLARMIGRVRPEVVMSVSLGGRVIGFSSEFIFGHVVFELREVGAGGVAGHFATRPGCKVPWKDGTEISVGQQPAIPPEWLGGHTKDLLIRVVHINSDKTFGEVKAILPRPDADPEPIIVEARPEVL